MLNAIKVETLPSKTLIIPAVKVETDNTHWTIRTRDYSKPAPPNT